MKKVECHHCKFTMLVKAHIPKNCPRCGKVSTNRDSRRVGSHTGITGKPGDFYPPEEIPPLTENSKARSSQG